ncbi:MAG: class I tRNA ligase family protein, partial [Acidimicrobiales bacterium]
QMTTDTQDVRMPVDMVCPYTGEMFTPEFITSSAGHFVAAPTQTSPSDPSKQMVSAYGVAVGEVKATDEMPLARNTSSKFDLGRNFANKVWNATRFALGRIPEGQELTAPVDLASATFADRWITARLSQTLDTIDKALTNYQFNVYADALYDFIWRDVCDRYLEAVKPTIDDNPAQQAVLGAILDAVLRILHPVCPFVTESLWPHVSAVRFGEIAGINLPSSDLAATAAWPTIDAGTVDDSVVETFERADQLIGAIRALRSARNVKPKQLITVHAPAPVLALITAGGGAVETLAGIGEVHDLEGAERPLGASPLAFEGSEVLISGLVDELNLDDERARLEKVVESKRSQIENFEKRLSNPGYVNNAKPELVEETRQQLKVALGDLNAAESAMAALN